MNTRRLVPITVLIAAFLVLAGAGMRVGAQGSAATPAPGEGLASYPAHIHDGACPEVGDVVYPLNNLVATASAASPAAAESLAVAATPQASPAVATGEVVAESTTDVEASLDEILSAERAINVHESDLNIQNYIACGDLTGSPTNGELQVQLGELNNSGFVGEAQLVDNGDGTTTVTVRLMVGGPGGTPAATPAG
jgi:hypothetical protein